MNKTFTSSQDEVVGLSSWARPYPRRMQRLQGLIVVRFTKRTRCNTFIIVPELISNCLIPTFLPICHDNKLSRRTGNNAGRNFSQHSYALSNEIPHVCKSCVNIHQLMTSKIRKRSFLLFAFVKICPVLLIFFFSYRAGKSWILYTFTNLKLF